MLHALCFSLQNAAYFIMLPFLVPVLFTFTYRMCKNLNVKLRCQKVSPFKDSPTNSRPNFLLTVHPILTLWFNKSELHLRRPAFYVR